MKELLAKSHRSLWIGNFLDHLRSVVKVPDLFSPMLNKKMPSGISSSARHRMKLIILTQLPEQRYNPAAE